MVFTMHVVSDVWSITKHGMAKKNASSDPRHGSMVSAGRAGDLVHPEKCQAYLGWAKKMAVHIDPGGFPQQFEATAHGGQRPQQKFTNLEVFPAELVKLWLKE